MSPAGDWTGPPVVRQIIDAERYEQDWPAPPAGSGGDASAVIRWPEHAVELLPPALARRLTGAVEQSWLESRPPNEDSGWWSETIVALRWDDVSLLAVRAVRAGPGEEAARAGGWRTHTCRGRLIVGDLGSAGGSANRDERDAPERLADRLRRALSR